MLSTHRSPALILAMIGVVFALGGCSGGTSIVRFEGPSSASISRAALSHWMRALAGGDFRRLIGVEGPTDFASEPADYPRCLAAAKLVAPRSFFNQLRLSRPEIERRCHELHKALKTQALAFLISVRWAIAEAAEQGIVVSNADVRRAFASTRPTRYPTEQDLRKYLNERHWSLSDLLYELKARLLSDRVSHPRGSSEGIGDESQPVSVALAMGHRGDLVARTSCSRGYVIPACEQYRGPSPPQPTPDSILRGLVRGSGAN